MSRISGVNVATPLLWGVILFFARIACSMPRSRGGVCGKDGADMAGGAKRKTKKLVAARLARFHRGGLVFPSIRN